MKRFAFCVICIGFVSASVVGRGFAAYAPYHRFWTEVVQQNGLPAQCCFLPLLLTDADVAFRNEYAAGVWALSAPVARHYGLKIDAVYDERFDVQLATEAAVAYLKDLAKVHAGDPEKQLAVYAGTTACLSDTVAGTIGSRLGRLAAEWESTAWASEPDAFVADTAWLCLEKNVRLSDFCAVLGMDSLQLFQLNPCLSPSAQVLRKGYRIYLPQQQLLLYAAASAQMDTLSLPDKPAVSQPTLPAPKVQYVVYRVKAGDTLGHIAKRYRVGVSQLKRWNNLRSDMLQIGQRLKIYQ